MIALQLFVQLSTDLTAARLGINDRSTIFSAKDVRHGIELNLKTLRRSGGQAVHQISRTNTVRSVVGGSTGIWYIMSLT